MSSDSELIFTYVDQVLTERKLSPEMIDHIKYQIVYDLIRGIDPISPYERRSCKITDEMWDFALNKFRDALKIKEHS